MEFQNTKSLTDTLRATRIHVGKKQKDVTKHTDIPQGRLSQIENGKRLPSSTELNLLASCYNVSYTEEMYWMGLAGFIPPTRMPTAKQIKEELHLLSSNLSEEWYPCVLVDYRFRIWAINSAGYNILGREDMETLLEDRATVLDILFSDRLKVDQSNLIKNLLTYNLSETQRAQVHLFKRMNLNRRHESWYQQYPEVMKEKLSKASYNEFEIAWDNTRIVNENGYVDTDNTLVDVNIDGKVGILRVQFLERLEQVKPFEQFSVLRFEPKFNPLTENDLIQRLVRNLTSTESQPVMHLWEYTNLDDLLDCYENDGCV